MKKIFLTIIFCFLFSIPAAYACSSPRLYTQEGKGLDPFSFIEDRKLITINSGDYPSDASWISYKLKVTNVNSGPMWVSIVPDNSLEPYVRANSIRINPGERVDLPLDIWIKKNGVSGKLYVLGFCENDERFFGSVIENEFTGADVSLKLKINSPGNHAEPQGSCFVPYSGCDGFGMYNLYSCTGDQYSTFSTCLRSCCKIQGGLDAYCTGGGGGYCESDLVIPVGTEGNIAFLCDRQGCSAEKKTIRILQFSGYNVTGDYYKNWHDEEFYKYDIIACSSSSACKATFNSVIYDKHILDKKSFLEITNDKKPVAAYEFGYTTKRIGASSKEQLLVVSDHVIVKDYYKNLVTVTTLNKPSFASISKDYLAPEVINLGNSGSSNNSMFFIADESIDHGKYAFIGWLAGVSRSTITTDGKKIVNATLKWLKENSGNSWQYDADIAFLCSNNNCKNEMQMIKWLRQNGYWVEGKSKKSWIQFDLVNFDFMMCNSKSTCKIKKYDQFYNAFMYNGIGFVEIPDSAGIGAGYEFGITNSSRTTGASVQTIRVADILANGNNEIKIYDKKTSVAGMEMKNLISGISLAEYNDTRKGFVPTMFQGNPKPYLFIGWFTKNGLDRLTQQGIDLLKRSIGSMI